MKNSQLEKDILQSIQTELHKSITSVLTGYHSPLSEIIKNVVSEHAEQIKAQTKSILCEVIIADDFKNNLREAFASKMARQLISDSDSLFAKISNDLKQDKIFRSKLTVAIDEIISGKK